MTHLSPFNNSFLLGFDDIQELLLRTTKTQDSFPPYNIEQLADENIRISLAVAGYSENDLEVIMQDNQLLIRGRIEQTTPRQFIHRGIAARSFIKSFIIADGIKIDGSFLENGLLNIDLKRPQKKIKETKIKINTTPNKKTKIATKSSE